MIQEAAEEYIDRVVASLLDKFDEIDDEEEYIELQTS